MQTSELFTWKYVVFFCSEQISDEEFPEVMKLTLGDVTSPFFHKKNRIRYPSSNHAVAGYSNQPTTYML